MATKSRKPAVVGNHVIYPDLVTRDPDTKYMGNEPLFATQPESDRRSLAMGVAFNWYGRFFGKNVAKEQLINYLNESGRKDEAKQLQRVNERELIATYGWLARLTLRGLELTQEETARLNSEISRLIMSNVKPQIDEPPSPADPEPKASRRSVQDIMRERAGEAAGEIEGWLDDFILAGARGALEQNPVSPLTDRNVLPQHVTAIVSLWRRRQEEFQAVLDGTDAQLSEAYRHYGKLQLRALIKFCEAVIAGLGSYVNVKKAAAAPRKRKAVPPEKQAAKVKYMKTFTDAATKLELTSIHPAKIIGATEVWAYDTAKRKLHYYVADSHVASLGVKGTAIVGFDTAKSGVKTLRKPADTLKKLMTAGKPAARKLFTEIKAVQTQPNGRTNDNFIILKAY